MTKLTDDELRELLELESKATPGPWRNSPLVNDSRLYPGSSVGTPSSWFAVSGEDAKQNHANARLVAAARNLARPLVEEVLRLRELLRSQLDWHCLQDEPTACWMIREALRDAD